MPGLRLLSLLSFSISVLLLNPSHSKAQVYVRTINDTNGCGRDLAQWVVTNNSTQAVNAVLNRFYENDGKSVVQDYPVTLGPGATANLGCSSWHIEHVGRQSYSVKTVNGKDDGVRPQPTGPPNSGTVQSNGIPPSNRTSPIERDQMAMREAIMNGDTKAMGELLDAGNVKVDGPSPSGMTWIMEMCDLDRPYGSGIDDFLYTRGADYFKITPGQKFQNALEACTYNTHRAKFWTFALYFDRELDKLGAARNDRFDQQVQSAGGYKHLVELIMSSDGDTCGRISQWLVDDEKISVSKIAAAFIDKENPTGFGAFEKFLKIQRPGNCVAYWTNKIADPNYRPEPRF
jgi:hypothetical protein